MIVSRQGLDDPEQTTSVITGVLIVLCGILLVLCGAVWLHHGIPGGGPSRYSPVGWDRNAALTCVVLGLAVIIGWLFSFLAALLSEILRRCGRAAAAQHTARLSPAFMRRLAAALLGSQLLVVPTAHALAPVPAPAISAETVPFSLPRPDLTVPAPEARVPTASLDEPPLPTPHWNAEQPAAPMDRLMGQPGEAASPGNTVVVGTGDSLWLIAARMAGPGASDAQIAHDWPRWYQANREAIGPDPDLLQIGTVLTRPRAELDQNGK